MTPWVENRLSRGNPGQNAAKLKDGYTEVIVLAARFMRRFEEE
jgi:hypothetical protein